MYSIGQNRICQDAVVFSTARTVVFCTARSRINLFTRLLVAQDRNDISLRKALGFTLREIKGLYFLWYLPVLLAGILTGIASGNLLTEDEQRGARKTLSAAAMTYVAATATALAQLLRLLLIFRRRSGRRDD